MFSFARFPLWFLTILALWVGQTRVDAQLNAQEQQVFNLMQSASGQHRAFVQVDPILSQVARARAADMAKRHYFDHVNPDGHGANYLVRQAGYPLPSSYPTDPSSNNIESIAAGYSSASETWSGWMASPSHKKHLLAEDPFFVAQTSVGIGYYSDPNSDYQTYWCVLSAPPPGPSLAISSPAANGTVNAAQATFSGTAGGAPLPAKVVYRLENEQGTGDFLNATGTQNWSASVSGLIAGSNTVRVRSLDASGGTIKEVARTIRYVILKPLVVAVDGSGSLTAGFLGTTNRELGRTYTIVAKPAAGWLFDHWADSDSTSPSYTFTMVEGLQLTAHFRVSPFVAVRGIYNGLAQGDGATFASSGFLKLSLNALGGFTGRLSFAGKAYALRGTFDINGRAELSIPRRGLDPLLLALQVDLTAGTLSLTGSVTDGSNTVALNADRALPITETHFAAGRYTLAITAGEDPAAPQGDGYAVVTVNRSGVARLAGALADGRRLTNAATLSAHGLLPIYIPLLAGTGSVAGSVMFAESGSHDPSGQIHWSKPERLTDRYQPGAVEADCPVVGSSYLVPAQGSPVLAVSPVPDNSEIMLAAGDLEESVEQTATLATDNKVTFAVPALPNLKLSVNAVTGRFSGSFTHPLTRTVSRISGVILQNQNAGFGYFLGLSVSGPASFAPAVQ